MDLLQRCFLFFYIWTCVLSIINLIYDMYFIQIIMFLSAVWTLILAAPIHCRASINETQNKSVPIKNQSIFSKINFYVNSSFSTVRAVHFSLGLKPPMTVVTPLMSYSLHSNILYLDDMHADVFSRRTAGRSF